MQLHFLRVFNVGTRTNYVYNDKNKLIEEPPGPYTKEGRASICTSVEQSVTSLVSNLKQLAVLTPEQRTLAQFGHDLILSSNRELQFWKESKKKWDAMNRINEILYRDPIIRTPIQGLGILFNDLLPQAIQNHENMVTLTIDMEDERQIVNSERRKSLIEWNKGTSIFVRKMVREVQNTHLITRIPEPDNLLIKLEKERLRLSNPSPSDDTTDDDELEQLRLYKCRTILIESDPSMSEAKEIETLVNTVLGNEDSTLFAISCTKILIPVLGKHKAEGWYERARVGGEGMETFNALNIGGFWKTEMDAWQGMLMQVAQIRPPKT